MKNSIITIADNHRRAYKSPSMAVYQMSMQHTLLSVSGEEKTMEIFDDNEEEWPVDPNTNRPFSPW